MNSNSESSLREGLVEHALMMSDSGLSAGKSGNLSVRYNDSVLITPTGIDYTHLSAEDIVRIDFNGNALSGNLKPSSEWHFHCATYKARDDIHAIVHTHSNFCTALACTERSIPAFHYMVAEFGGDSVPCAEYATFGTEELASNAVSALKGTNACLLAHHGAICVGETIKVAYERAANLEALASQYCEALKIGGVKILGHEEMQRVINKFRTYGQQ